jgi:hypothetical protein
MPAPKGNQYAKGSKTSGRPLYYDARFHPAIARNAARCGRTREQIGMELGVTAKTLREWEKKYPDFKNALNTSQAGVDGEVVDSLYRRAIGYDLVQTEIKKETDPDGNVVKTISVQKKVHIPPDPTSMIFWLKNRQRKAWNDWHKHEHSGPAGGPIEHKATIEALQAALTEDEVLSLVEMRRKLAESQRSKN